MIPTRSTRRTGALLLTALSGASAATLEWQRVGGTHAATPEARAVAGGAFATPNPESQPGVTSGFLGHPYLVNTSPFLVSSLTDLRLARGVSHPGIRLDTIFADLDGDTVRYKVESGLLGAVLEGGVLRWQNLASGVHSVVVEASDGTFATSDTFQVEVLASTSVERRRTGPTVASPTSLRTGRLLAVRAHSDGEGSLEAPCPDETCLALDILLPGPGRVEVHIFDNLGTPVVDLQRRIDAPAFASLARDEAHRAVFPLSWNLRSRDGRAVASGVYLWRIRVVTDAGEEFETIRRLGVRDPR